MSLAEVQCHLDKEGASNLVIDLIMNASSDRVFHESILLAIALLEGGNTTIQVGGAWLPWGPSQQQWGAGLGARRRGCRDSQVSASFSFERVAPASRKTDPWCLAVAVQVLRVRRGRGRALGCGRRSGEWVP